MTFVHDIRIILNHRIGQYENGNGHDSWIEAKDQSSGLSYKFYSWGEAINEESTPETTREAVRQYKI